MLGMIKRKRGTEFGFITPEGSDKEVFFHSRSLVGVMFDELREGDAVVFEIEESPKGPRAVKVERL